MHSAVVKLPEVMNTVCYYMGLFYVLSKHDKKYVSQKELLKKVSKLDSNSAFSACEARALPNELQGSINYWAAHTSKVSVKIGQNFNLKAKRKESS